MPCQQVDRSTVLISGHTPLPSWIKFSAANISFTGSAPQVFSQIAPPQYFSVTLIASTHPGFASASQSFNVVVGAHVLEIFPTTESVNTTVGGKLSYTFPLDTIKLDNQVISKSNISSITADMGDSGSWLNFDNTTMVLSGTPSKGDKSTTVTFTVQDVFADVVRSTLLVDLYDGLFTTTLPTIVNATIGEAFSFTLNDTFFAASDVVVTVSFTPDSGSNWLSYDSNTRTISGTPSSSAAQSVQVDINASSASLNEKQSASLHVQTISSNGNTVVVTSTSPSHNNKALIISLSVILPLLAIAICICAVCFYRRRRKSSNSSVRTGSPHPPISRPYNTTPEADDWPLEEEKSWGSPRQLGGMGLFKRGVSGIFTLKTSDVGTTDGNVGGNTWEHDPEKTLPTPKLGGPREPPPAARGSWRRSDGRDWTSVARSSDASLATVSTNEIFSVRLVQSPNPNGLNPISPAVGGISPLLGGMGIRGAAPVVNVHPPPEERTGASQDTIGTFSEGSSGVDYEGNTWEPADRMFPQGGRGSGLGHWRNVPTETTSRYSVDSFQSNHQADYGDENGRGTWYQKRDSSRNTLDDAVEYPVSRVSGPLSPVSPNVEWDGSSGISAPGRPRLVEFTKERKVNSSSSSGHGSGEVAFV
jgi:hypothetical protein